MRLYYAHVVELYELVQKSKVIAADFASFIVLSLRFTRNKLNKIGDLSSALLSSQTPVPVKLRADLRNMLQKLTGIDVTQIKN